MVATSSRMLRMLSLLQARRDWPGVRLAERLEVSTRTVRRDVDRLRELGYRIEAIKGPDGGYRLAAGAELPPLLFDEEQAVALSIALQNAAASGADIGEGAARALATLRQVMPSRLRNRIDGIRFNDDRFGDRGDAQPAPRLVDPSVLETVSDAVRTRTVLRFGYGGSEGLPRRVEPHGLVARDRRWYLVAWDLDRVDWRIFRLDRLAPRTPGGARFAPRPIPTGDARTFVAARFKGANDENRWPCIGEVVIHLPAREVAGWLVDGDVEERDDGSSRVVLGSWNWMGLLASLARFDAPFDIVGPPALAEAAAVLARRLVPPLRP
ncbi:helix-turn-helix transcriptional regulator [Leifsonia sp. LS-T14]|uniref:helix-turn-helix transcriptional regulator n=1 Tax=unclassified Leifsonia TaxID=2663824 RepID=UPI0035A6B969